MSAQLWAAVAPAGLDPRDIAAASLSSVPEIGPSLDPDGRTVRLVDAAGILTPQRVTAWQNAVAAATADPQAPWRVRAARDAKLANAIATLRQWSTDAGGTNVTSGNAVAVLQVTVTRFGVLADNLADLLTEWQS